MASLCLPRALPSSAGRWLTRMRQWAARLATRTALDERDDLQPLLGLDARTLRDIGAPDWAVEQSRSSRRLAEQRITLLLGGRSPGPVDPSVW